MSHPISSHTNTVTLQWYLIDGHSVYGIKGEPVAALPIGGKRAKTYQMFATDTRERLCQLRRAEVDGWLLARARVRADLPLG